MSFLAKGKGKPSPRGEGGSPRPPQGARRMRCQRRRLSWAIKGGGLHLISRSLAGDRLRQLPLEGKPNPPVVGAAISRPQICDPVQAYRDAKTYPYYRRGGACPSRAGITFPVPICPGEYMDRHDTAGRSGRPPLRISSYLPLEKGRGTAQRWRDRRFSQDSRSLSHLRSIHKF